MTYRVEYLRSVVEQDIPALDQAVKRRVRAAIESKLASKPIEFGRPLRHSLQGARRLRVGDWRVNYKIEPPAVVVVVTIGHRSEVYG